IWKVRRKASNIPPLAAKEKLNTSGTVSQGSVTGNRTNKGTDGTGNKVMVIWKPSEGASQDIA
ncbi:hypothetical protein HAX54_020529, partial [Datura stramonium]|nr:hypothetical protein [Datura stramonium]